MTQNKAKTVDGAPIPISKLNVEPPAALESPGKGVLARVASFYRHLNEVMSGMYTGVGCAGTPHSHHSYEEQGQEGSKNASRNANEKTNNKESKKANTSPD